MRVRTVRPGSVLLSAAVTVSLFLTGCDGGSSGGQRGGTSTAKPEITKLIPDSGDASGGNTVTIITAGFEDDFMVSPPRVFFDSAEATLVTAVDASSVDVMTPPDPNPTGTRTVDVNMESASGVQMAVFAAGFTYTAAAAPCLEVTPNTGSVLGGEAVTITMLGPCFLDPTDPTVVTFGGILAPNITFITATQLGCITPPVAAPGPVEVVVTGKDASGIDCVCAQPDAFTYQ